LRLKVATRRIVTFKVFDHARVEAYGELTSS